MEDGISNIAPGSNTKSKGEGRGSEDNSLSREETRIAEISAITPPSTHPLFLSSGRGKSPTEGDRVIGNRERGWLDISGGDRGIGDRGMGNIGKGIGNNINNNNIGNNINNNNKMNINNNKMNINNKMNVNNTK